jgi:hypothetical protein
MILAIKPRFQTFAPIWLARDSLGARFVIEEFYHNKYTNNNCNTHYNITRCIIDPFSLPRRI